MASNGKYLNQADYNSTSLTDLAAHGLSIPNSSFIEEKYPGKLEELYTYNGNEAVLHTVNNEKEQFTGHFATRIDNTDRIIGKNFQSSMTDAEFITKFLTTGKGTRFLTRQFLLQGYQPFDETKLYNPASPILAAAEPGMWGLLDRPTRHIDSSNVIEGVIDAVGAGTVVSTIGSVANIITGDSTESLPSPPRSSVASDASSGISMSTLTSMLGASSKVDIVMAPIARDSVKGLLRGGTATDAYTSKRYARIVQASESSLLGRLASSALSYVASNTVVGSIVNPTQPWDALYRADEKTYDFLLTAKELFFPKQADSNVSIVDGILNAIGFSKFKSYSGESVPQRFRAAFHDEISFYGSRYLDLAGVDNLIINKYNKISFNKDNSGKSSTGAYYSLSYKIKSSLNDYKLDINNGEEYDLNDEASATKSLKYTDVISREKSNNEISDILLLYKNYIDAYENVVDNEIIRRTANPNENKTQRALVNYPDKGTDADKYTSIKIVDVNKKFFTEEPQKYSEGKLEELYNKTLNNKEFYDDTKTENLPDKLGDLFSNQQVIESTGKLSTFNKPANDINESDSYKINLSEVNHKALYPLQFDAFNDNRDNNSVGYAKIANFNPNEDKYLYRLTNDPDKRITYPTIGNRQNIGGKYYNIFNNNNHSNYINNLGPISELDFSKDYLDVNSGYGPDFIKFYFYDIVNKVYIPFNAIISSIQEANNGDWTTIDYVNRADKLYHYNGFSRTLNFAFKIIIGSVSELLPTWKRINYLVGLTRPSNYTLKAGGGGIVPPMVQLTLGDFYKNHFIIIRNVGINIKNEASWETVPEEKTESWRYGLKDAIQLKDYDRIKVAQFPREADINVQCAILEKDRPMVGHGIWGDAPVIIESTIHKREVVSGENLYENKYNLLTGELKSSTLSGNSFLKETYTEEYEDGYHELFPKYPNRDFSNQLRTSVLTSKLNQTYTAENVLTIYNPDGTVKDTIVTTQEASGYAIVDSNNNIVNSNLLDRYEELNKLGDSVQENVNEYYSSSVSR